MKKTDTDLGFPLFFNFFPPLLNELPDFIESGSAKFKVTTLYWAIVVFYINLAGITPINRSIDAFKIAFKLFLDIDRDVFPGNFSKLFLPVKFLQVKFQYSGLVFGLNFAWPIPWWSIWPNKNGNVVRVALVVHCSQGRTVWAINYGPTTSMFLE